MAHDPELTPRAEVPADVKAAIDAMDLAQLADHYQYHAVNSRLLTGPAFEYFMARFRELRDKPPSGAGK